ncbi:hypothetical protein GN956_G8347 [Arapaima gigas]
MGTDVRNSEVPVSTSRPVHAPPPSALRLHSQVPGRSRRCSSKAEKSCGRLRISDVPARRRASTSSRALGTCLHRLPTVCGASPSCLLLLSSRLG